jgi:molecular chaperone GrpE
MQTQQHWNQHLNAAKSGASRTEPTLDIDQLLSGSLPVSDPPAPQTSVATPEPPAQPVYPAPPAPETASSVLPEQSYEPPEGEDDSKAVEFELREKLAEAEEKAASLQEALIRTNADLEKFRRRAQDDVTRAHKFAIEGFAESLVPVKDSLETALKIETATLDSIKEGVEMTLKQLNTAFERNRLTEICPMQGDKLDPMKHQAISTVPADQSPNTIISVLQKGYLIADRLLRPALVTVAQEKTNENES